MPNGRNGHGQFAPGNQLSKGRGNPNVAQLNRWRSQLPKAITGARLRRVIEQLAQQAEAGEPWAIKELLDRTLGKPVQPIDADILQLSKQEITLTLKFGDTTAPRKVIEHEPDAE